MQGVTKVSIQDKTDFIEYEIRNLNTTKALRILNRLNRLMLAPIGSIISNLDLKNASSALDSKLNVESACKLLSDNMDEDTVIQTIKELVSCATLGTGMPIEFDIHFEGRLMHLFRLVTAILKVNYQDFFDGLTALKDTVSKAVAKAVKKASQASTGLSTDQ
jgi:hypothetical protein